MVPSSAGPEYCVLEPQTELVVIALAQRHTTVRPRTARVKAESHGETAREDDDCGNTSCFPCGSRERDLLSVRSLNLSFDQNEVVRALDQQRVPEAPLGDDVAGPTTGANHLHTAGNYVRVPRDEQYTPLLQVRKFALGFCRRKALDGRTLAPQHHAHREVQ